MSDDKVSEEFNENWVLFVNLNLQVFNQFLKHVLQDSQFNIVIHGKDFDGDGLVNWKNLLDSWAIISNQNSCGLLKLTLRKIGFGEFHKVSVKYFSSLLVCKTEAFFPLTSLGKHFEPTHVSTFNDLVEFTTLDKICFLLFLDLVNKHALHLSWSYLLSAFKSSVPLLALDISFDGFLEIADGFIDFSS